MSEAAQVLEEDEAIEVGLACLFHWATMHEQAEVILAAVKVGRGDESRALSDY